MHGLVFLGERRVEVREFADPEPGPGEVVLAIRASGLCGSDLHRYRAPRCRPVRWRTCACAATSPWRGRRARSRGVAGGGPHEAAGHAAPLCGLREVRPVPVRVAADVRHHGRPCLRHGRERGARPVHAGAGDHPRAARRCAELRGRRDHRVRRRDRLGRLGPPRRRSRRCHADGLRPGAGRSVHHHAARGPRHSGDRPLARAAEAGAPARRRRGAEPGRDRHRRGGAGADRRGRGAFSLETSGATGESTAALVSLARWVTMVQVGLGGNLGFEPQAYLRRQITIRSSWSMSIVHQAECARFVADR